MEMGPPLCENDLPMLLIALVLYRLFLKSVEEAKDLKRRQVVKQNMHVVGAEAYPSGSGLSFRAKLLLDAGRPCLP